MSLNEKKQEDIFSATSMLVKFLKMNDPMFIFSKEIYPQFTDKDFEDCYSKKGRNAISPAFFCLVTMLQFMENFSDPEAADACVNRIDWKIALHIPVEKNESFDPTTLCKFRARLKSNNKMSLIFDKVLNLIIEKGFIKKRTSQRLDATHIIKHVNRISTTDLLYRTVKCVVEKIEKQDCEYYEKEVPEYIKERYSGKFSSFGLSKEKRGDKQAEIVEDGLYLQNLLKTTPYKDLEVMKQIEIMETIFNENIIIVEKKVNEKIFIEIEEIECPKQTIFDPRDLSIKLGKKGNKSWVGAKCHIAETANKGEINFITNMLHQRANEHDSNIHDAVKAGNEKTGLEPEKLYVDTAYISGKELQEYEESGTKLMGYFSKDGSKKEGFKLEDFKVDMTTHEAICPENKKSENFSIHTDGAISIYFKKEDCMSCCHFKECVGITIRENKRRLNIHPEYNQIRKRREEQKTKEFKKEMSVRAQIEGTISEAVRFHGLRKLKLLGELGHQLEFLLTGAGINVKRLLKALIYGINLPQKG